MREECLIELLRDWLWRSSLKQLPTYLRMTNRYRDLARSLAPKQEPAIEDGRLSLSELVAWYLDRVAINHQTYSDVRRFAEQDPLGFKRVALREYLSSRRAQPATTESS